MSFNDTLVPLSAKSFCSTTLRKKDTAAIGAILDASILRCKHFFCTPETHLSSILL